MKEIRNEIIINASPDYVWHILTDFSKYSQWNPFIRTIEGMVEPGALIEAQIGFYNFDSKPLLLKVVWVEPNQALRLRRQLFIPGIFDTEYVFEIEPLGPNQTKLIHREIFSGLLAPLFTRGQEAETQYDLEALGQTMKVLAEHNRFSLAFS